MTLIILYTDGQTKELFVTVEPWVALQDVAKHLQVAEDTVHRWIAKKKLPAVRAGRVWRFKLSEIDEWLRNGGAQDSQDGGSQT